MGDLENDAVLTLRLKLHQQPFYGLIESVPAYASLAIFYDPAQIRLADVFIDEAFVYAKKYLEQLLDTLHLKQSENMGALMKIPVLYNGVDLPSLAALHKLAEAEIIRLHTEKIVKVFMIGFLPGFAYMGSIDQRLTTPRLATPRTNVAAGTVGIAGRQTGIYPINSPGGWQQLGQTPIKIFDLANPDPCLLKAGDRVQFISISKERFNELNEY